MEWYKIRKNVLDLLEFLMDCELIVTKEDVIHYNKFPDQYTEVWRLYKKEIMGSE